MKGGLTVRRLNVAILVHLGLEGVVSGGHEGGKLLTLFVRFAHQLEMS